MSQRHCSVDQLAVCQRQQKECERAQEALSRVTSCFQQLVSALGSSADCSFLREELEQSRRAAHQLCTGTPPWACPARPPARPAGDPGLCAGLSQRLVHLLSRCDSSSPSSEDRQRRERLWVLSLSAFEGFLSDLRTASVLTGRFPLTQAQHRRSLVNTGQQQLQPAGPKPLCAVRSLQQQPEAAGGFQTRLSPQPEVLGVLSA